MAVHRPSWGADADRHRPRHGNDHGASRQVAPFPAPLPIRNGAAGDPQSASQENRGPRAASFPSPSPVSERHAPIASTRTERDRTQQSVSAQGPLPTGMRRRLLGPLALAVGGPGVAAILAVTVGAIGGTAQAAMIATVGLLLGLVGAALSWRRVRIEVDEPAARVAELLPLIGGRRPSGARVTSIAAEMELTAGKVHGTTEGLRRRAEWGERSQMIFEALEMAQDETAAYEVAGAALSLADGSHPSEVLMTRPGGQTLRSVADAPAGAGPGCPVDDLCGCVAVRRGQILVTPTSESIDACPKLRGRAGGACSAVCVPVTIAGQPVGVIHSVGEVGGPPAADAVERIGVVSRQLGARVGALRALASSRREASTDGLTGLPNRRAVEGHIERLLESRTEFVAVLADLDKFKHLNDRYGHEAGDRALQLFASVVRNNVRSDDLVARVGGEEFVMVCTDATVEVTAEKVERLRSSLASAQASAGIGPFTCSFGLAHSSAGGSVAEILRVADAGLLQAKKDGGDTAVPADEVLARDVFSDPDAASPPHRAGGIRF